MNNLLLSLFGNLVEKANDNVLILFLLVILVIVLACAYLVTRHNRVIEIKHNYTAKAMRGVDDIIYGIKCNGEIRFTDIWGRTAIAGCRKCRYPIESYNGTLESALRTLRDRFKERWHENGFSKMSDKDFEREAHLLAPVYKHKNQEEMVSKSGEHRELIKSTHDERFSDEEAYEKTLEILLSFRELKPKEEADLKRSYFFMKGVKYV